MSYFDADMKLLPLDSEGWEIYSGMDGAGLAAHNMTRATQKALDMITEEVSRGSGILTAAKQAYTHVYETLEKYRDYGAVDTEPRGILIGILEEFVRRRFEADIDLYWEV
jgi:hypothetical protein